MKGLLSLTAGCAVLFIPSVASATTFSFDKEMTNACYEAAAVKNSTGPSISRCDRALIREASTKGDNRVATLVNRGILLMLKHRSAAAVRDFDEAILLNPAEPEAWLGKAIEAWKAGDDRNALGFADKALAFQTQKPALAYLVRGLANEGMGNVRAAYRDLKQARVLAPRWSEPVAHLARYKVVRR